MTDQPPPTPVGQLLRRTRELAIPKLSRADVARKAGVDPGTLGNIERGYRSITRENVIPVPGDATVIAKVAAALGLMPADLEGEGKRTDAAERLQHILRKQQPARPADLDAEIARRAAVAKESVSRLIDQDGRRKPDSWYQHVYGIIDDALGAVADEEAAGGERLPRDESGGEASA